MTLFDLLDANMEAVKAVGGRAVAQAQRDGAPACYMDPALGTGLVREMPDGTRERFHHVDGKIVVNADEAARRIAPANPEAASLAAGRLVIRQLDALIRDQASFVYETTLSGLQPIGVVRRAKQAGYEIDIVFVIVATVELNIQRVAQRVAQGGHDI